MERRPKVPTLVTIKDTLRCYERLNGSFGFSIDRLVANGNVLQNKWNRQLYSPIHLRELSMKISMQNSCQKTWFFHHYSLYYFIAQSNIICAIDFDYHLHLTPGQSIPLVSEFDLREGVRQPCSDYLGRTSTLAKNITPLHGMLRLPPVWTI